MFVINKWLLLYCKSFWHNCKSNLLLTIKIIMKILPIVLFMRLLSDRFVVPVFPSADDDVITSPYNWYCLFNYLLIIIIIQCILSVS